MAAGVPKEGTLVEEGTARVIFQGDVFYNPVQVFNRDLSIHVIKLYDEIRRKEIALRLAKRSKRRKKLHHEDMTTVMQEMLSSSSDSGAATAHGTGAIKNDEISETSVSNVEEPGGLRILEALSATGLRSIRYVKEIPGIKLCVANDISADAVEAIKKNVEKNGVSPDILRASHADAISLMHDHKNGNTKGNKPFHVIDLDPYGAPGIFLDGTVQATTEGGLICVTCTDLQNLCGSNLEACYMKYGAIPVKPARYCHEMALRMCLGCINVHAARYGRYIVPLMSVFTDFYIRLFVRVYTGHHVRLASSKMSRVLQSNLCDSFMLIPVTNVRDATHGTVRPVSISDSRFSLEEFYGASYKIGGPAWNAPIHCPDFVQLLLRSIGSSLPTVPRYPGGPIGRRWKKLNGVLSAILLETACADVPLYYSLSSLCATLHCSSPKRAEFFSALRRAGYRVTGSHCNRNAVKTDAPNKVIWDILRAWVKLRPVTKKRMEDKDSACAKILSKEPTGSYDFTIDPKVFAELRTEGTTPFLPNPEKYWGPKQRAKKKKEKKKRDRKPVEGDAVDVEKKKEKKMRTDVAASKDEESVTAQPITQELQATP